MEIEDFLKAKPDVIAHSAADIVSHLKAGGEKTIQGLKALCWRYKDMQVEVSLSHLLQSNHIVVPLLF